MIEFPAGAVTDEQMAEVVKRLVSDREYYAMLALLNPYNADFVEIYETILSENMLIVQQGDDSTKIMETMINTMSEKVKLSRTAVEEYRMSHYPNVYEGEEKRLLGVTYLYNETLNILLSVTSKENPSETTLLNRPPKTLKWLFS